MYVTIDPASGSAELAEPENLKQFHVALPQGGDAALALQALGSDGAPADGSDHVWVSVAAVRRWAAGRVGPDWESDFSKMLEYADSNGWLDDTGSLMRAHIEEAQETDEEGT